MHQANIYINDFYARILFQLFCLFFRNILHVICFYCHIFSGCMPIEWLEGDRPTNYQHNSSIDEFQGLADVLRDDMTSNITPCPKFSLMFDESTDISVWQNLITFIRYLRADFFWYVKSKTCFLRIYIGLVLSPFTRKLFLHWQPMILA